MFLEAEVTLNNEIFRLCQGSSIDIPLGAHHSIANKQSVDLVVIEVQMGSYFGEDDIIRLKDPYNR